MKEIDLNSWEEFETHLSNLQTDRVRLKEETPIYISPYIFRGQSDKRWGLTSTLNRYVNEEITLERYYRIITAVKALVETFTGKNWEILSYPEYQEWLEKTDFLGLGDYPAYPYMVYLRHHGFPSPLLDWTRSPYVAACFSFCKVEETSTHVSIYAFLEQTGKGKSFCSSSPYILSLGPYVKSHQRHFLQRSEYTVCLQWKENAWYYTPYEEVINSDDKDQDILWKFNIPATERVKVLKKLDAFNLNSFSLFGSEESLMETIALREFYFRETNL